jgi:hypothetical protein
MLQQKSNIVKGCTFSNVKFKFSVCSIKHQATKSYGGVEIQLYALVYVATDGDKWSASHSGLFTPRKSAR